MAVSNVQFGADITELENAAKQSIALLTGQQVAIEKLMITQYEHNIAQNKYNATVKTTLDNGRQVISLLKNEGQGWDIYKQKVREATNETNKQSEARKKAKQQELDTFLKGFQNRTDKYQDSLAPEEKQRKTLLNPADLARIAEAQLFKSSLNFVTNQLGDAVSKAKEFQIQISLIRTVSQDAQLSFGQWSKGIKDVSDRLGIDLVSTAKAAYDAIQSQVVVGPQTLQFLESAGNLARTTGTDIKQAGDLLASVIQGYEQSITQADHTAAVLFKTVELGRIQINELANTMGRVAPSANVLGISLEETAAALATLTRQGIKTSDATTLVTNVILKLAKPTEGMTKFLREMGFATSEAAVKTLGFAGLLRELEKATQGGKLEELAQFFNELRGLRGAVGLTSAFADFEKDLSKINNAEETFIKAQEIRAESSADKLQRFATNVKNVFVEQYGQAGLSIAESVIGPLGSGEKAAQAFSAAVLTTIGVIGAGRAAMYAYATINAVATASITKQAAATYAATAGQEAYNVAIAKGATAQQAAIVQQQAATLARANYVTTEAQAKNAMVNSIGTMALLTAAVTAGTLVWQAYSDKMAPAVYETEANLSRIGEAVRNISRDKVENIAVNQLKTFQQFVDATFKAPLKAAAQAYKQAQDNLVNLESQSKGLAENLSVAYKGWVEGLRDNVKSLDKDITKATNNIKQSRKEATEFKDTLDDIIRDTQYKYATEQQKLQLTEQNISRLKGEIDQLYQKGDNDSIASARKKYDEIAKLLRETFDTEQGLRKASFEQALKEDPTLAQYGTTLTVSTLPLQQRLNALLDDRNTKEALYVKTQEKTIDNKKKEVAQEEERIRNIEIAAKKVIDFDVFDKGGKVKQEFTSNGKFDENKVRAELSKLTSDLTALTPNPLAAIDFYEKLYARVDNIVLVANAKTNEGLRQQDQQRILKTKDELVKAFKDSQDIIGKASSSAFSKGGQLDLLKDDAGSFKEFLNAGPGFARKYLDVRGSNLNRTAEAAKAKEEAEKAYNEYIASADRIRTGADKIQGQLVPRKADIEASDIALQKLTKSVLDYVKVYSPQIDFNDPSQVGGIVLPGRDGKGTVRLGDILNDLKGQREALLQDSETARKAQESISGLYDSIFKTQKEATVPLLLQFPELGAEAVQATDAVKTGMDAIKFSIDETINSVIRLKEELKNLPNPSQQIMGNVADDEASYFATGGFVGFPGKPRGSDRIPVWMAPGEFVVNARDTQRFYSQLVDINRGKQPRYFANGGLVTNNVGDIHVTVNGADTKSPARLGRALGNEIRRELKRGNLR